MTLVASEIERWLEEDLGEGDATSLAVIDEEATCTARMLVKETATIAGLSVATEIFQRLGATVEPRAADGDSMKPGVIAVVEGPARGVLAGERLALNVVGRLSGIATLTRRYVDAVAGTGTVILDTRKTTPGLRALEKHAVVAGGGRNHRFGLYDGILIKDNHLRVAGSLATAVARAKATGLPVEAECDTLEQVREALAAGAEWLLLDNMPVARLREAVAVARGRARLEASGGITLANVRAVAETGVDFISVGALTHSAHSVDVSLEVE